MRVVKSLLFILFINIPIVGWTNNLFLENVSIVDIDTNNNTASIEFDISWDNSWRAINDAQTDHSETNWDAAWVFAKYRVSSGDWNHCTLATSGHSAPTGSTIENPSASTDNRQTGVFIYRNATGSGSNNWDNVKIKWNYGSDDVEDNDSVEIRVFGIEMCFVPEGSYYLGDGVSLKKTFEGTDNNPVLINTSEKTVRQDGIDTFSGDSTLVSGIKVDGDGGICTTGTGAIDNPDYPTGYNAFYCMKYEITQEQYVDFLNTITSSQASAHYRTGSYRHTISGIHPNFTCTRPDRACNYIFLVDGMAYLDWAGLRPMTELEYEKACRGTLSVVAGEYAWGTTGIVSDGSLTISGTEDGTETITIDVSSGACVYGYNTHSGGDGGLGPLRVGIFAESGTNRVSSGATFYGIMEMNGNLWERIVSLGSSTGREFQGTHGNGSIGTIGYANISDWPGYFSGLNTSTSGSGCRGGSWYFSTFYFSTSNRYSAAFTIPTTTHTGFRGVRSK